MVIGSGLLVTLRLVVLLVRRRSSSSTLSTTPVHVLPMMPSPQRVEEPANSTVLLTYTRRLSRLTVLPDSTVVSSHLSLVLSSTVAFTSVSMIP